MPLIATRGASSVQGFGQFAQASTPVYVEDVFSTSLWTGNDTTQTITNGIDLSTKGGLAWIKSRAAYGHILSDTSRGTGKFLSSNTTDAQGTDAQDVTAFNTTGFTVGNNSRINNSSFTYVGWTFRKQPKFFDVVTFTAPASGSLTVNHNLGSTPGFITTKRTDSGSSWISYHRSTGAGKYLSLNTTNAAATFAPVWANVTSTSFEVTVGVEVDANGTYVAYLFAHDAGGFGLTGLDNVISCGTFTTDGSGNATVNLGYEPQWVLYKGVSGTGAASDWTLADTMRGYAFSGGKYLAPNQSQAEGGLAGNPTATGFVVSDTINTTWIYIAIRRGPMKVPTDATKVFTPVVANTQVFETAGFPVDMVMNQRRDSGANIVTDRQRNAGLGTYSGGNESSFGGFMPSTGYWDNMTGYTGYFQSPGSSAVYWNFRRAPSFFDVINWYITGSSNLRINHNLTVTPELIISKPRSQSSDWYVYHKDTGVNGYLVLNSTAAAAAGSGAFGTPTSTEIGMNTSGFGYNSFYYAVSYLFATCAGVSKVGSYTGTGTTLQINCGFTAGARFVLIKRTDSTGDWYVWDTARGIISGNDPYLLLNSASAEATSTDYIDSYSAGFELSSTAPAAINASAGTFIFLAIA